MRRRDVADWPASFRTRAAIRSLFVQSRHQLAGRTGWVFENDPNGGADGPTLPRQLPWQTYVHITAPLFCYDPTLWKGGTTLRLARNEFRAHLERASSKGYPRTF
jgi:hypothetical protein